MVEIETWCQSEGRIGTRRDWILKDYATGQVIGRATRSITIFSFMMSSRIICKCVQYVEFILTKSISFPSHGSFACLRAGILCFPCWLLEVIGLNLALENFSLC